MTCPLIDDQTIEDLDFEIPCVIERCDRAADLAVRLHGDPVCLFFCEPCYRSNMARVQRDFYGRICDKCYRPVLDITTHIDKEVWLKHGD